MTIGQDITPGIVTDIDSLPTVSTAGASEANTMLVGQGDLSGGDAEPNTPYTISRPNGIKDTFGTDSMIANAISDAFNEGAMPVYATVAEGTELTEDSITSTSGTLDGPITENMDNLTVDDDGTEITPVRTYGNPADENVGDTEVAINPVSGEYEFGATPTSGSITYTSYDYQGVFNALEGELTEDIDYVYVLSENQSVRDNAEVFSKTMEQYHELLKVGFGVSPLMTDTEKQDYTADYDNSRIQGFYPSRSVDGDTIIGAVGGLKARYGINASTMNSRLRSYDRLIDRIDFADEETLLQETTVPVQSSTRGALLVDDPTMIAEDNEEEAELADGYSRMVVDRATDIAHEIERPYVGSLNKPSARGSLQTALRTGLQFLKDQEAILDYEVTVRPRDAMSAYVDLQVTTIKPLRNIYNTISVGSMDTV